MSETPPQDTHDHITVFDASDPSVDDATVRALMRNSSSARAVVAVVRGW